MANFFSAVQGKFTAKFHGRYLGQILEQIAAFQPSVLEPIIKRAAWNRTLQAGGEPIKWSARYVETTLTEVQYLNTTNDIERRADLGIVFTKNDQYARLIVEIKMLDSFLKNQLEDYVSWAKDTESDEDRCVVVLTAFPISVAEAKFISDHKHCIRHMYLSDLHAGLEVTEGKSELIQLFRQYLLTEGYAMFTMSFEEKQDADYQSFVSFMVMNFLPHAAGFGKNAAAKKISRGPEVFSHLIQNWQLVSDRLAETHLAAVVRPTIRYFPEQLSDVKVGQLDVGNLVSSELLKKRKDTRSSKSSGRYWLTADIVLDSESKLRLEWGQIFQIEMPDKEKGDHAPLPLQCFLYALVRIGQRQIGVSMLPAISSGIKNQALYQPESFMDLLLERINKAVKQAESDDSVKGTQAFDWGKRRQVREKQKSTGRAEAATN